jgi:hypothetical protein
LLPTTHILSFGGGVNSVALVIWLLRAGQPLDEVVFADTGAELPETYSYFPLIEDYLSQHSVPFRVLPARVRGRDLYQTCWDRRVFPSTIWRWSTRDFKVKPIFRYYRSLNKHINQYLAIAYDELERMRTSPTPEVTNLYPLVENKITRTQCVELIQDAGLPLPVKSSCFFCPFSSLDRWKWLYQNHPDLYEKAVALEENSKHFPSQRLTDQVFRHRAAVTLRQLPHMFEAVQQLGSEDLEEPCGGECMT